MAMPLQVRRTENQSNPPRVGMLASVRNRRAIVGAVDLFDGPEGRLHMVQLEYIDADGPRTDSLIWEREIHPMVLEPNAAPRVDAEQPMASTEFDALQRAVRWTALSPYLTEGDGFGSSLIAAPLFGAVQAEDFQLVPLLKAMRMPRISLLLADDVGLGKTIEAGLILTELLLRRRIRRVLIICPATLRKQWAEEMKDKFALDFETIDRAETFTMQKRLGLDANPWRTFPRIITSYYYLRQPDVLEQFMATCRQPEGAAQLPWDLLIVDEAHNLMPANFGEDSDLAKMLRIISPYFEHKLFLTATPHNGHTRCFSGLLEQLDPVRFTQTNEFMPAQKGRIEDVVIRRLKREINDLDRQAGKTPRFSERILEPLPLYFDLEEERLARRFQTFRKEVKQLIASRMRSEQLAGSFAVEVLNKRLLSCPVTFADSWHRFMQGLEQDEQATTIEVNAARRSVDEYLDDDLETEGRIQNAARTTGAWLKPLALQLTTAIQGIKQSLAGLGLEAIGFYADPVEDARFGRLLKLIQDRLRDGEQWRSDERLIVFTEYKTTLDYLERRLVNKYGDRGEIRVLYGGMPLSTRETIKRAFNDPQDRMRILIATDAASEGLNLQETARYVLHYDIPFNPSRLDQRNGRLDRHGQARDVVIFHFTSANDADLRFLGNVVKKVNTIREELGSMGEVFDAAFERRFAFFDDAEQVEQDLDLAIERRRGRIDLPRAKAEALSPANRAVVDWFEQELDIREETLRSTLEHALAFGIGMPRFAADAADGQRVRLVHPLPPQWEPVINTSLRYSSPNGGLGPLPNLVFDPSYFVRTLNGRQVFRNTRDTVMVHLGHPMFHQALSMYARTRFPGSPSWQPPSRWTVRYGDVPTGADALLLIMVEELATNELRESFHHWARTLRFPVVNEDLGERLPHVPAGADRAGDLAITRGVVDKAREIWDAVALDLREAIVQYAVDLDKDARTLLAGQKEQAIEEEQKRFRNRIDEVRRAMQETSLNRLRKELDNIEEERTAMKQAPLLLQELADAQEAALRGLDRRQKEVEDELQRRQQRYEELLEYLQREQKRVVRDILPKRYALRNHVQVFPVTVEIRLPEVRA